MINKITKLCGLRNSSFDFSNVVLLFKSLSYSRAVIAILIITNSHCNYELPCKTIYFSFKIGEYDFIIEIKNLNGTDIDNTSF